MAEPKINHILLRLRTMRRQIQELGIVLKHLKPAEVRAIIRLRDEINEVLGE